MNNINESIKQAIQQHLPAAVAGELKEYIENAQKLEVEVNSYKKEFDGLKAKEKDAQELENLRKELKTKQDELDKRQLEIEGKQRGLDNAMLTNNLAQSERRADQIIDLVRIVFKNPTVSNTISGVMPVCVPTNGGNAGYMGSGSVTLTTTTNDQ